MAKLSCDGLPDLGPVHPRFKVLEEGGDSNPSLPKEENDSKSVRSIGRSPGVHDHDGASAAVGDSSSMFSQLPYQQKGKLVFTVRAVEQKEQAALPNQPREKTPSEESRTHAEDCGRPMSLVITNMDLIGHTFYTNVITEDYVEELPSEAEKFLARCQPSKVQSSEGSWITVKAPLRDESVIERDLDGLEGAWTELNELGEAINFQTIQQLAVTYGVLSGKWMIFRKTGIHIDLTWERVFRAVVISGLGRYVSAKVSTADEDEPKHVICVYNKDFTNKAEVREIESRLRAIGIRCPMMYKPDVFTHLGVYSGNEWGLKPVIYRSNFDVRQNSSIVVSQYDGV